MLGLASRLRDLPDADLQRVIGLRGITSSGIHDFFDLAEALLEPGNVNLALSHLDRSTLAVLGVAGQLHAEGVAPTCEAISDRLTALGSAALSPSDLQQRVSTLHALALVDHTDACIPYPAVTARLAEWPADGLPGIEDLARALKAPDAAAIPATELAFIDQLAAERAFAAVSAVAELIRERSREPARQLTRGGLGLPDTKRLQVVMSVDLDQVNSVLQLAARTHLIARSDGYWMETETGEEWLRSGTGMRWEALAATWLAALPRSVAAILPAEPGLAWGNTLGAVVSWLYPAGAEWMLAQLTEFARDAETLGITARDVTGTAGAHLLHGNSSGAVSTLAEALPEEVGNVYLQHDLSIVAPGPLAPAIDSRLRRVADIESRELASSYRITPASVSRALAAGEDATTLLDFLGTISLTGIPQPVRYLISESAERYGRVRVGTIRPGPTAPLAPSSDDTVYLSYVSSSDSALLGTIGVDQTLAAFGLVRAGDSEHLLSRFAADTVFWALTDARYPVAAEDETGHIVHRRRHGLAAVTVTPPVDTAQNLVEKLRLGAKTGLSAADAWLARQLDSAIKGKQTVLVSIAMPGGTVVEYLLEPASVSNGRFRARDRRADIERTLPLKSIRSITPAP